SVAQPFVGSDPQRVVTRIARRFAERNVLKRNSGRDRTGRRQSREGPDGIQRGIEERLINVSGEPQVRPLRSEVSDRDGQTRRNFPLNVEVPRLDVGVVKSDICGTRRYGGAGNRDTRGIRELDRRYSIRQRHRRGKRWVSTIPSYQIGYRLIGKDRI